MNSIYKLLIISILTLSVFITACNDDEPIIPNEEELITTLIYTLTPQNGGDPIVMRFEDLDGEGGNPPSITGGTLAANTVYDATIELLNEAETPAEDITVEVQTEGAEHQFFFETHMGLEATFTYTDQDTNGQPIGLSSTVTTGAASTGHIMITLRHEPSKNAVGVSSGDITNAGGETDIEVMFEVSIQ